MEKRMEEMGLPSEEPEKEDCALCDHLLKACEKEGNKKVCKDLLELFKQGKIGINEFTEAIEKKFGKDLKELMGV
jgi:hypothetical protein